jgi:hypothetical protein
MKEILAAMKDIDLVEPMVSIRSTMKTADEPAMETLAESMLS